MQIKAEQKTKPVTYIEALAALWCVKLQMGQYPFGTVLLCGDNSLCELRKFQIENEF